MSDLPVNLPVRDHSVSPGAYQQVRQEGTEKREAPWRMRKMRGVEASLDISTAVDEKSQVGNCLGLG